jgi:hypothetical protein
MKKKPVPTRANILGGLLAEYDHEMLRAAFYESPDYRSLIESGDRTVVVGRRGTGKSALFYRLENYWGSTSRTTVIKIAPEDYETISLQGLLEPFRGRLTLVRAAAKLAWRYALTMEVAQSIRSHFKFSQCANIPTLTQHLREWSRLVGTVPAKMRTRVSAILKRGQTAESLVGDLANDLQLNVLAEELSGCLDVLGQTVYVLIDRLDEGYESNELSIGLIDGFLHASIEINHNIPSVWAFIFLRDNIFRTIEKFDADYSRQIEGQVIRLHWDEYHLLNLIANRLRAAFNITEEPSIEVWNKKTFKELAAREGFRRCLRLTLYRPRDLLVLLNNAFYNAFQHNRTIICGEDIEHSATEISQSRFSDLLKEYHAIFPGLDRMTRAFGGGAGLWRIDQVRQLLSDVGSATDLSPEEIQHFVILGSPEGFLHALYSVGFLGLKDSISSRFKFCHDGNQSKFELDPKAEILVHPCYWRALNINSEELQPDVAEELPPAVTEIRDEYDIDVASSTPAIRKHRIGQIISALPQILEGNDGAGQFEDWCNQAIAVLFAAGLRNIELKPNGTANQRRDLVARNEGGTAAWNRILLDYQSRQVIFEVKNYKDLGPAEYRQMVSYLVRDYGSLGFFITRETDESLLKGKDLAWVREMFFEHNKLIVKLTGVWLSKYLSKARSPQKHNAADIALNGLLDRYVRNYLSLGKG